MAKEEEEEEDEEEEAEAEAEAEGVDVASPGLLLDHEGLCDGGLAAIPIPAAAPTTRLIVNAGAGCQREAGFNQQDENEDGLASVCRVVIRITRAFLNFRRRRSLSRRRRTLPRYPEATEARGNGSQG